ncbi:Digestive organ expansion factor-like protein, partial [Armadillidium nasatum]
NPNVLEFDATFNYFTKELLPRLRKKNTSHVLIYIPDYCDYVRLNYYFHKDGGTSFATINEYMIDENSKVAKARSLFFDGKKKFLLYTERFHFHRRYKIKGVRHIVFYSPPLYPHFFKEVCELLSEENQNRREKFDSISYIYLLYHLADKGKLIDLIGTNKALEMLKSGKNYHSYLTGI